MAEAAWYYMSGAQRVGPVTQDQLCELARSGTLPLSAQVYCTAFNRWVVAGSISALRAMVPVPVVPLNPSAELLAYEAPSASHFGEAGVPQVRPWIRLWARALDVVVALPMFILLCVTWTMTAAQAMAHVLSGDASLAAAAEKLVYAVLLLVSIITTEAAFFALTGTTPGKAFFAVVVRRKDGSRLSFIDGVKRSADVMLRGCFLFIPYLWLLGPILAAIRLGRRGVTMWDEGRFFVAHRRIGSRGQLVAAILVGFVLAFLFYSGARS